MSIPSRRRPSAQRDYRADDERSRVLAELDPPILGREDLNPTAPRFRPSALR